MQVSLPVVSLAILLTSCLVQTSNVTEDDQDRARRGYGSYVGSYGTNQGDIPSYGRDRVATTTNTRTNSHSNRRDPDNRAAGDMTLVIKVPESLKPVVSSLATTFLGGVKPISSVGSSPLAVTSSSHGSSSQGSGHASNGSGYRPSSSSHDSSDSGSGYTSRPSYGTSSNSNRPSNSGYGSSGSDYGSSTGYQPTSSGSSSGYRPSTGSTGYGSSSGSSLGSSSSSSNSGYQPTFSGSSSNQRPSTGYGSGSSSGYGSGSSSDYNPSSSGSGYQPPSSGSSSSNRPYGSSSSTGYDRPGLIVSSGNNRPNHGSSSSGSSDYDRPSTGNGGRPGSGGSSSSGGRRPVGGSIPTSHQSASWTNVHPETCGSEFTTKIIGGHDADPKKWKWMAGLLKGRSGSRSFCGGAIIDQRHVVTAAHCLRTVTPRDIMVRIGEYDFSDSVQDGEDYPITNFKIHPYYDRSTQENDIAIITLARPVSFEGNIRPICLPQANRDYAGQISTIVGWGATAYSGSGSSKLKQVSIPIWTQQECSGVFKEKVNNKSMFCAGMRDGGRDSCQGDSGGPLMVQGPGNRWMLAGVVSWGIKCGSPGYPGVYTKVSDYLDWIHDNIRN